MNHWLVPVTVKNHYWSMLCFIDADTAETAKQDMQTQINELTRLNVHGKAIFEVGDAILAADYMTS